MSDSIVKSAKVPFDVYDFFGYLFPGAVFGIGLLVNWAFFQPGDFDMHAGLTHLSTLFNQFQFVGGVLLLGAILVTFYLLGHVVASFGSLVFEKYFLKGIFGYPTQYYLNLRERHQRRFSESLYKIVFLLCHATLIAGVLSIRYSTLFAAFEWLGIALLVMVVFRLVTVFVRPSVQKAMSKSTGATTAVSASVTAVHWIVANTIDRVFQMVFGSTDVLKPFHSSFVERFKLKFKADFGLDVDWLSSGRTSVAAAGVKETKVKVPDTNVFWLSHIYLVQNFPQALPTVRNFLHLYSFTRNVASASFLLIIAALVAHYNFRQQLHYLEVHNVVLYLSSLYVIGVVMLLRYFYLYSSYFTKYILRAYLLAHSEGNSTR